MINKEYERLENSEPRSCVITKVDKYIEVVDDIFKELFEILQRKNIRK